MPLVLAANDRANYCDLAGVSTEVEVSTDHAAFRDKMLITHRGLERDFGDPADFHQVVRGPPTAN